MTKLAVIHLSDMHVHGVEDPILGFSERVASACFSLLREADACVVAVTGDIAFSGKKYQYEAARDRFFKPLLDSIGSETGKPVYFSAVPGNHDCVLIPVDTVREIIINAVVENPEKAEDYDVVKHCASVQDDFFEFCESLNAPLATVSSRLFWQQNYEISGKKVLISGLNAAWMSRLSEKPGHLIYPIKSFDGLLSQSVSLHLALIHHPFNWYSQSVYQSIRQRLRLSCTAVLSGHEHLGNIGKIEETLTGSSMFFEATALQPHEKDVDPGFSAYLFDLEEKEVLVTQFAIKNNAVESIGERISMRWDAEELVHGSLALNPEFLARISDAGGNFTHAAKENLSLDDVFVWPDLRDSEKREIGKQKTLSASTLPKTLSEGGRIIVYGDDKSGKSALLYKIYQDLISKGLVPVYINAGEINVRGAAEALRQLDSAIGLQYIRPAAVQSLSKQKRVLLIDDVDRLKSGASNIAHLLECGARHFLGICVTASSSFEVTNLVSKEAVNVLAPFVSFDLLRFGLKLRHQLIKKWCGISGAETKQELDRKVDDVETIVNTVVGRQLVPEYPIYLLILLQSSEQHRHGEIQNSGLSYYYQFLITKSLGEVGVRPRELDEHFNYLSLLAWSFQQQQSKELELTELHVVNHDYCSRFFTVDLLSRLNLLERARVLSKRGDCYSFAYPYIYYFFVGRYLARNIDRQDIRAWVEESCKKLYLRERAHAIMFLTHHAENGWVIGKICDVLRQCFSDKKPIELNGDTDFLNDLVERSVHLTIESPDVDKNQSEVREISDQIEERERSVAEADVYDDLSFTAKWNLLHKTAEILGLILKNYYGSLERTQKQEMIKEVFDAPLRAMTLWLEEVAFDINGFVREISVDASIGKMVADEVAERQLKKRIFNIMGMVATGVVASAGSFVSTEKLREDIGSVVSVCPTNSYRLIEVASRLLRPGSIPMQQIKILAADLEKNPYAFGVLQSLGFMHMYMYHTDEKQKQALSQVLNISISAKRTLTSRRGERLLK